MTLQVFENLQPLSVCMSYQGTMNIVEKISEDHDIEVQEWADELVNLIEKPSQDVSVLLLVTMHKLIWYFPHFNRWRLSVSCQPTCDL